MVSPTLQLWRLPSPPEKGTLLEDESAGMNEIDEGESDLESLVTRAIWQ